MTLTPVDHELQNTGPAHSHAAPPRVSIIMNVHNGVPFLRPALNSVLAQTFKDWELIFWDDRSTDGSAAVLAEYPDARIRYVQAPREVTLGRARALALGEARGQWVAFLDQDDLWLPDKLAKQLARVDAAADPDSVGIIYGRSVMFTPSGSERDFDHRHEFVSLPEGDIFQGLFLHSCFICISSAMLRRSAVLESGGIPGEISIIPDYVLFVAIANRYDALAVQDVVCRYRVHSGNMSRTTRRRMHEEALWLLDHWRDALEPRLLKRRQRIHETLIGFDDLHHARTAASGLMRIAMRGSLAFLLSRPFARAFRALRRHLVRPIWMRSAKQCDQPAGPLEPTAAITAY